MLLLLSTVACGDKPTAGPASATPPAATSSAPVAAPRLSALGICDMASPDDHVCFEFDDAELFDERARICGTGSRRHSTCPTKDVIGTCRLPDGSIRYGYPPKTPLQHEKACKEARGKYAPGSDAPPADAKTLIACRGKHKGACEQEDSFTSARIEHAKDECSAYGGTFVTGEGCDRDKVVATCDLEGKRTIVFYPDGELEEPDEQQKFCEERRGKFVSLAANPAASASSTSTAAPNQKAQ